MKEKKVLQKFSKSAYLEKVFPYLKEKKSQSFLTLSLSLLAIAIFGFFAINPTIGTIIELRKELSDAQYVHAQLQEKISNLGILGQKYSLLENDLSIVNDSLPTVPKAPLLIGQINALAKENHVQIVIIHTTPIIVFSTKQTNTDFTSFAFSVEANGTANDLLAFISALANGQRIVTFDSIAMSNSIDNTKHVTLTGKGYIKK